MHAFDVGTSLLSSSLRGWRGTGAFAPAQRQPERLLELYEFEACPYCRRVREALTALDLDALIYPCPAGGQRFRPHVVELGGKSQFPLLLDPNTDTRLYESGDIIDYLARRYDGHAPRLPAPLVGITQLSGGLATIARGLRGAGARPSRAPAQPLELYGFESSPYTRLVREVLCELELPYISRSAGKASWRDIGPPGLRRRLFPNAPVRGRNRRRLLAATGRVQLPYLVDPNRDMRLFESAAIIGYLQREYAAG
ncbi:MAG: glutathione S-transferase N-terminal domain-containing protein [Gammaproteobacteria bacterium]|nr:glutathione S-transferase N-terminal domain-containing protein [Gammaproteobacteria bacterium]